MQIVQADPAEYDPYNLCTRRIGNAIAVGVRIRGAGAAAMTVERSHRLTIDIGCRLRERFGEGAFVAVHVEPLMQRAAPFARRPPLTGFRSSFFSLRRSSQVCFRRRNLCRRPLFGADVRCARPVRRNGLAPHPFPVRMPGWEGQIRMRRRASSPDRCRPVRPCRAIAERAGAFLVCILCLVLPKTATEKRRNRLRQESFNCYFFHIVKNVCYLCAVETAPSLCGGDGLG